MHLAASQPVTPAHAADGEAPVDPGAVGHPRGTLAIVTFYGLLFAFGWLMIYLWLFVPRGTPHP